MSSPFEAGTEAFLRAEGRTYLVEIQGVAKDAIWTSFPDTTPPAPGTGVELDVHLEDGIRRYHTRVAAAATQTSGVMLERTETAQKLKHRRSFRVSVNTSIWVLSDSDTRKRKGRLGDLSQDGARIVTERHYPVGESLVLHVKLPKHPVTEYPGRVVYAQPAEEEGAFPVYGVKFGRLSAEARTRLTIYLAAAIKRAHSKEVVDMYDRGRKGARKKKR